MNIQLDDGLQFGLGVFETICMKEYEPILLQWHLERMNCSLTELGIPQTVTEEEVLNWLSLHKAEMKPLQALKIMATEKNKLMLFRGNPYTEEIIAKGFRLDYSPVWRNETSIFTYHKTMNYGDNIRGKRDALAKGIDEVIFLNSKGQICEGSTTNIFFVKDGIVFTPQDSCGLLPGIMRKYVLSQIDCCQTILYPEDVMGMEECFVTNSLMGIMPVTCLGDKCFSSNRIAEKLQENIWLQ